MKPLPDLKQSSQHVLEVHSSYTKLTFSRKHYLLYDGGTEAIRNGCWEYGTKCDFHSGFDIPAQLSDGWSDLPVKRFHPSVPNYFDNDGFNFHQFSIWSLLVAECR